MKRREAIRNILLASASTLFITGCSEVNVVDLVQDKGLQLDSNHKDYLSKISESFLPIADLKNEIGNPADFIMTMINDCHSPEEIASFAEGFEQYKLLMKESRLKIQSASEDEIIPVVESVIEKIAERGKSIPSIDNDLDTAEEPPSSLIFFINKTKDLSIQNLMSSEYFMTEHLDYSLIPKNPFNGCAPI